MGSAVLSRLLTASGWTLVVVVLAYLVLLAVPIVVASLTRDPDRRADMLRLVLALTPHSAGTLRVLARLLGDPPQTGKGRSKLPAGRDAEP